MGGCKCDGNCNCLGTATGEELDGGLMALLLLTKQGQLEIRCPLL